MSKKFFKRFMSVILSFAVFMTATIVLDNTTSTVMNVNAATISLDYAPQLMNIALYDDSKNLSVSSTADKAETSLTAEDGSLSEQWRIDYCGANSIGSYYKIVNASSGRLLTPYGYSTSSGTSVVAYGNENDYTQYWYIIPVSQDSLGNDLYYKIVNYSDSSMALTAGSSTATLESYSGANSQKWLLNCAGLQGFAGYCYDDNEGNIKASDIGGLLGETVEVSTFDELSKYATSDTPYTIVVTANIKVTSLVLDSAGRYYCPDGRIYVHSNKTIIGSYSAHTLYNVQFCTSSSKGTGDNIIIKNFELQHDAESNGNDSIVVYFGSGENLWVDHCTFTGHSDYNTASTGLVDCDKFLACCYDADYCTVSDCSFGLHEYGLILGYPADNASDYATYAGYPRMTIMNNKFTDTYTRAPGLMRYGYFHSLNNYVYNFALGYTLYTACNVYAESCYYDGGGSTGSVVNDSQGSDASAVYVAKYTDSGSTAVNCYRSNNLTNINSNACTWRPSTNYSYTALTASAAKTYCSTYSGVQSSKSAVYYSDYSTVGVPSATYMVSPDEDWEEVSSTPEVMAIDTYYMIKNSNSGLYLDVENAAAAGGTNVQQWGASEAAAQNTWRFVYAEDGYYYIQSMVGDKTYVMDVTGGKTANGTNIEIYNYKGNDNQKFMITANSDGTYKIRPKVADGSAFVEIADASVASGGNCQIWENTGSSCQDWIFEEVEYAGETMDTTVNYMFKNANSNLYMEVKDGSDTDGANVQQWEANGSGENDSGDWNSWTLKLVNSNWDLYYIVSNLDGNRYLTISDGNAEIDSYNKLSTQYFRFVKNPDGTYDIVTRAGYNSSTGRYNKTLEVADASTSAGGNVQQWELNGASCQNWVVETFTTTTAATTTVTTTTTTVTTVATTTETTAATTNVTTAATTAAATTNVTTVATTAAATTTITTAVTTTETTAATTEPIISSIKGDINLDNKISIADLVLLQKYLTKSEQLSADQAEIADMNEDGIVNVFDMVSLRRILISQVS